VTAARVRFGMNVKDTVWAAARDGGALGRGSVGDVVEK